MSSGVGWLLLWPDVRRRLRHPGLQAWGAFLGLALVMVGGGGWRWAVAQRMPPSVKTLQAAAAQEASVRLVGQVAAPPRWKGDRLLVVIEAQALRWPPTAPSQPVQGRVLVSWWRSQAPRLAYGDVVLLYGRLAQPPRGKAFDYRAYLARRGIYAEMHSPRVGVLQRNAGHPVVAAIFRLREKAYTAVQRLWPLPEAGFFAGILLGLDSAIPESTYAAFRTTGTAHVLVISGFNIAIMSALVLGLFRRVLPTGWAALLTGAAVAGYTVLVGGEPPVVRAALMGSLALLARHLGRRSHGFTALAVVAALMTAWKPQLLLDVSFQLSFAATLGLLAYGQTWVEGFERLVARWLPQPWPSKLSGPVGEFLLLTLAAQVAVLPITVGHFGEVSPIALLANPLILPVQTLLMVLGGLALLGEMALPGSGRLLAWMAWPWAVYTIRVVEACARLPGASWPVDAPTFLTAYAMVWAALSLPPLRKRLRRSPRWAWVAGLWALNAMLWGATARQALLAPLLRVWLLPASASTAVLVQPPTGETILVNGGDSGIALNDALGRILGSGGSLDWWVVASSHRHDVAGLLAALEQHPPKHVLWVPRTQPGAHLRRLHHRLTEQSIPLHPAAEEDALCWETSGCLQILDPADGSAHVLLRWRGFALWLAWPGLPDPRLLPTPSTLVLAPGRNVHGPGSTPTPGTLYLPSGNSYSSDALPLPQHSGLVLITDGDQLWMFTLP